MPRLFVPVLALYAASCETPRPWAIAIDHAKLGQCLATGGSSATDDGETTISAGTVLCVRSQRREGRDRDAQHASERGEAEGDASVVGGADSLGASPGRDP